MEMETKKVRNFVKLYIIIIKYNAERESLQQIKPENQILLLRGEHPTTPPD